MASRCPVLVVEDDPDLRWAISELLTASNFSVRSFQSPLAALDALLEGYRPAVAIINHQTPEMQGTDLRREMLADPELAQIPAILFSGDQLAAADVEPLRMRLMQKPATATELLAAVGEVAGRRRHPR